MSLNVLPACSAPTASRSGTRTRGRSAAGSRSGRPPGGMSRSTCHHILEGTADAGPRRERGARLCCTRRWPAMIFAAFARSSYSALRDLIRDVCRRRAALQAVADGLEAFHIPCRTGRDEPLPPRPQCCAPSLLPPGACGRTRRAPWSPVPCLSGAPTPFAPRLVEVARSSRTGDPRIRLLQTPPLEAKDLIGGRARVVHLFEASLARQVSAERPRAMVLQEW